MASGTLSTRPQAESAPKAGRYEEFIQTRLEHTRRQVRMVDVGSNLILLIAASLFFFLIVAVADHWVFAHGLNFFARFVLWGAWLALAGTFAWRFVAPSVMHRINPVFAAHAIEQGQATLKNSLINFLLLRSHPEQVAPVVYQAMEHRAASDLLKVPAEHAVDHRRLIHLTYVLAAAVVLFAIYLVLSPKNPFISAARVIWPWAGIAAPTRVHIDDVLPGDAVVFRGDAQPISAHISGLRDGEEVALLISTLDGQVVDDRVSMTRTGDDERYACDLPPVSGGMQQDTLYRITAGDATTQQYKLEVQIAPTIIVDQVDYHFPQYTGFPDRTIKGQGDIKALEGTRVTIHASANLEIKEATIDLGCNGLRVLPMKCAGTQATGEFTLALDPEKPGKPLFSQYQIQFTDVAGNKARRLIQHHIDVDRDYPPEIEIIEPKSEETSIAVNGHVKIRVHAFDSDFALRRVTLHAERGDQPLPLPVMLDRVPPEKAFAKPFDDVYDFQPVALGLKVGDRVKYWAAADDNKEPRHNHSETSPRTIKIVSSEQEAQQEQQNQQPGSENPQPGDGSKPQPGSSGKKGEPGQNGSGEESQDGSPSKSDKSSDQGSKTSPDNKSKDPQQSGSKDSAKPDDGSGGNNASSTDPNNQHGQPSSSEADDQEKQRTDPDAQRSDAMKKILDDEKKQQQQENKSQPSSDDSKQDQKQDQKQQDGKQDGSEQGGQQQNGGKQDKTQQGSQGSGKSQDGSQGAQQSQSPSGGEKQEGNNGGKSNSPDKPGGENSQQQGGNKPSPEQGGNNAEQSGGSKPQGEQKPGSQSSDGQPQGAGSQDKKQPSGSAGAEKGGSSGSQSKPDPKQGGSKGEQQSAGSGQSPKEKQAGGSQGSESKPGGSAGSEPKKSAGSLGSESNSQLAMKGSEQDKDKKNSAPGSSANSDMPGGSKPDNKPKPESSNSGGGGQGSQQKKQEKNEQSGGGGAGGEKDPQKGSGQQPSSGGGNGQSSPKGSPSGNQGNMADGGPHQQDPGKSGDPQQDSHGAPSPQVDPQKSGSKPGDAHGATSDKTDKSQSPGNSPHDSKSEGESKGDRKGGGGQGGGQPDQKPGKGAAGTTTPASDGGSVSKEQGSGATGDRAGQAVKTTDNKSSPSKQSGEGSGEKKDPTEQSANQDSQKPQDSNAQNTNSSEQKSTGGEAGSASSQQAGTQGAGLPSGGSPATGQGGPTAGQHPQQNGPDAADLDFSKKQVDLALRHLKDEMGKQKPELLDRLGWSKDEAQKFYDNISKLRDAAQQPGHEPNKQAYNEFLKNLDLHPRGTRLSGGTTKTDEANHILDAGQMAAPAEWSDLTHEYTHSIGNGK